jgi:hypothetical protein
MTHDPVNHPAHYNQHPSGVECVTIASGFDYCLGNCVKYLWRAGLKADDPLEDLRKAAWYLDYRIKQLEEKRGQCTVPGDRLPTIGANGHRTGECLSGIVLCDSRTHCNDPRCQADHS